MPPTRDRLLEAAMRLFGEQGYAATSVAQIEAAAGLSPGAGGLYAHYRSKKDLLRAGLDAVLAPPVELLDELNAAPDQGREQDPTPSLSAELDAVARAGLARLRHDRDFNRVLVRDLRSVPELLELSAERELRPVHAALAAFLAARASRGGVDTTALAAVLISATSHFWLLSDVFGEHPAGVSEDDFVAALVQMAVAVLEPAQQ